ncbi:MAG: glycosyltransferase family protein [Acidimicrobiia bacterium]
MLICLVAPNDADNDPRARVSRYLLEKAGHQVTTVVPVPDARPTFVQRLRDGRPRKVDRAEALAQNLARTATASGARLFVPTDRRALEGSIRAARDTGGAVSRTPKMDRADEVDLIDLAPSHPEMAAPAAGIGLFHTPDDPRVPYTPEPGRHAGRNVVLCYRKSEINPGKYLEEGLRRSGATVRLETDGIDLGTIDPGTDFVIFVEGPYPALEITGRTVVPTLFWFHHGEHHLHANLRLADRYRADAVLMAHSWHLAYWLPAPVHRFPFGMATELLDASRPLAERTYDVAMVGAKLRSGGPYGRRQKLIADLEKVFPTNRLGFLEEVSADQMAVLYGDSRIVVNEGGTRHYPITMRVLEAVGSGAVLLSDRLPGMEMLLEEGAQYALLGEDVASDVAELLAEPDRLQAISNSALARAMGLHTYDHRVDELFEIASSTGKRDIAERQVGSPMASAIERDAEVQRVAHLDIPELVDQLPDREVWDASVLDPRRLGPGKMETVAIRADDVTGLEDLLRAARRYIYLEGRAQGLTEFLEEESPRAVVTTSGEVTRVDLMAPSYRIMPFEVDRP